MFKRLTALSSQFQKIQKLAFPSHQLYRYHYDTAIITVLQYYYDDDGIITIMTILLLLSYYDSFIFDTYKIGLVDTLLFQFFKICPSLENFHIEVFPNLTATLLI